MDQMWWEEEDLLDSYDSKENGAWGLKILKILTKPS